jgi:hypothetical protein
MSSAGSLGSSAGQQAPRANTRRDERPRPPLKNTSAGHEYLRLVLGQLGMRAGLGMEVHWVSNIREVTHAILDGAKRQKRGCAVR